MTNAKSTKNQKGKSVPVANTHTGKKQFQQYEEKMGINLEPHRRALLTYNIKQYVLNVENADYHPKFGFSFSRDRLARHFKTSSQLMQSILADLVAEGQIFKDVSEIHTASGYDGLRYNVGYGYSQQYEAQRRKEFYNRINQEKALNSNKQGKQDRKPDVAKADTKPPAAEEKQPTGVNPRPETDGPKTPSLKQVVLQNLVNEIREEVASDQQQQLSNTADLKGQAVKQRKSTGPQVKIKVMDGSTKQRESNNGKA